VCVCGGGPLRLDETLLLVHPQRLRVHSDELGGAGSDEARAVHQRLLQRMSARRRATTVPIARNSSSQIGTPRMTAGVSTASTTSTARTIRRGSPKQQPTRP